MNLKDIRTAIFSQADWAPTQSTDAITRVNDFINRAYFQLVEEAPFLFFQKRVSFFTRVDKTPDTIAGAIDDLSVVANDAWVLQRNRLNATPGLVLWDETGAWRGRMILLTDAQGIPHRRMIRDIWTEGNNQRMSLYRPWNNVTATTLTYRIYSEDYYLPDNVIEVNSMRLFRENQSWPLDITGQMEAEYLSLAESPSIVAAGVPRAAFRRYHQQIESPTAAPLLEIKNSPGIWLGPEPPGQFEYCFTYCWGYRDADWRDFGPSLNYYAAQTTPSRLEPMWESSPSPTAKITSISSPVDGLLPGAGLIRLTLPDIDYMQGFGRSLPLPVDARYHRSGWRKRIYRRRITVDPANYNVLANKFGSAADAWGGAIAQETPDAFVLFDDIPGFQVIYDDTGAILPDYHRRLREVNGYQSIRLYPRPDQRYQVDVRCLRRPEKLKDDYDAPEIHQDGMNVLVSKALMFLYEAQGNMELVDRSAKRYQEQLFTLSKRYGDLRYPGQTLMKRPARSSRVIDSRRPWRRWYNLPNS